MLVAIVGQTASGKSSLGIDLAVELGGTGGSALLGMDAMQLYRGLDIGTAKTPIDERRGIPHYQIDQLDVEEDAAVASYQAHARSDIIALQAAGRPIVAVGGSGLYARALLDEMSFPDTDAEVRARLEAELEATGPGALHSRLQALDPEAAARIHPHNGRRIVRALEVIEITGRPFSATLPRYEYHFPGVVQMAVAWENEVLDQRIDLRTRMMFDGEENIIEETRVLLDAGHRFGKTAARATGYAEALAVLRGELTTSEATERVALATRQLARRQMKWFRRDPRITWLRGEASEPLLEQALRAIG